MFTHLHTHTEYSELDGLSKIPALVQRAKSLGQEALAITDHGNLYGAIDFYRECTSAGLRPVLGMEAYVAPGDRRERKGGGANEDASASHLVLLAMDNAGWRNLIQLATRGHLEGFYRKPRVDRELLEQYSEGLICLSGCPSSEMGRALLGEDMEEAHRIAAWYREVFDGRYYLEVQRHEALPQFEPILRQTVQLSHDTGLRLAATQDAHYCEPGDHDAHELLLCIGTNATIADEKRFKFDGEDFYLTDEEHMRRMFHDLPQALDETNAIAERCDVSLEFGRMQLPKPDLPDGKDAQEHLADIAWKGLEQRLRGPAPDDYAERLRYELSVVEATGFAEYFLIVADFSDFANRQGIAKAVRGSAAGSLILYCIGITDIDPMEHGLTFERFLNPERKEMPDIDMDFADDRRGEVIRYVSDKYGRERVAQIITFGTLGAKAAIRDTGRALGMSLGETDRLARMVPGVLNITVADAIAQSEELRQAQREDSAAAELLRQAERLNGVVRHAGTHAAAVVISERPLAEDVPLRRPAGSYEDDAIPMTQWAMDQIAAVGLLKMDFLGLSNLTILQDAVKLIEESGGDRIDLQTLPDGDRATFEMLAEGDTFGVFQLESGGMRRMITDLKPETTADLSAAIALFRPGPMEHIPRFIDGKHGKIEVQYPHPDLGEILDETYGVIVYQDQVLQIARKFAGYSLGQADVMRKAMGKKIPEVMQAERGRFTDGALANGYDEDDATAIFELIEPFAGYAFNKAHSVCYAEIAYQTAYLKANYPAPYMAALLRSAGGTERVREAAAECSRMQVPLLPPDINRSSERFSLEPLAGGRTGIRFGLATVKNVGHSPAASIIEARGEHGDYENLSDLCERLDTTVVNRRALESLAMAGALDDLGERGAVVAQADRILKQARRMQELKASGQTTMFNVFGEEVAPPLPEMELDEEAPEAAVAERLAWERDLLGTYVSQHPLQAAADSLASRVTAQLAQLDQVKGSRVKVGGLVNSLRERQTRKGDTFAVVELEDLSGTAELTVWPEQYQRTKATWSSSDILVAEVTVKERGEGLLSAVVEKVETLVPGSPPPSQPMDRAAAPNGAAPRPMPAPAPPPPTAAMPSPAPPPRPAVAETPRADEAQPGELWITMAESGDRAADSGLLGQVEQLLISFRGMGGSLPVFLEVRSNGSGTVLALSEQWRVPSTFAVANSLDNLLGDRGSAGFRAVGAAAAVAD